MSINPPQSSLAKFIESLTEERERMEADQAAEQSAWDAMSDEEKVFHKLKTPPPKPESPIKVFMPLISRIIPNMIAAELCGVHPISTSDGTICTIKPNYENKKPTE